MSGNLRMAVLAAGLMAFGPGRASAQFEFLDLGVYGAQASESFDGSRGLGVLLEWDLPVIPVGVRGSVERYFPDCGDVGDCATWAYGVDALAYLPLAPLSPYALAGWTRRKVDPGDEGADLKEAGLALGIGARVDVGAAIFGEVRREFVDLPRDQWVLRLGVIF
jgi:hypothetical protein